MAKINRTVLKRSIKKIQKMSLKDKEAIIDEIYLEQPNLLASVLVLKQMGSSLEDMEVLINILLVTHLALKDACIKLLKITENDQDREMARFVGHVKFTEGLSSASETQAMQDYINSHEEQLLLAHAYNEMSNAGFTELRSEAAKYLILAGVNIVNCISTAKMA